MTSLMLSEILVISPPNLKILSCFLSHFTLVDFPLLSCGIRLSAPLFTGFVKLPLCIRPHIDGTSFQTKHSNCGSAFLSHERCAGTIETENFWKQVPKCNLLKMQPPVWPRKVAEQSAWEPGDVTAHFTALKKNVLCTDTRCRLLFWTSSVVCHYTAGYQAAMHTSMFSAVFVNSNIIWRH